MKVLAFLNVLTVESNKLATLTGRGGNFVIPAAPTKKPVGEFQVNRAVGTVSGLFCDEIPSNASMKKICSNENGEDSVCTFLCHQTRSGIGMGSQVCACAKMRRGPIMVPLGCEWKGQFPDCREIQTQTEPNVIDSITTTSTAKTTSTELETSTTTTTTTITTTTTTTSTENRITTFSIQKNPYEFARRVKVDISDLFTDVPSVSLVVTDPPTTIVKPFTENAYTTKIPTTLQTTVELTTVEPTTVEVTTLEPTVEYKTVPETTTTWKTVDVLATTDAWGTTYPVTPYTAPYKSSVIRSDTVSLNEIQTLPQHVALEAIETALSYFEPSSIEKLKRFIEALEMKQIPNANVSPSERKLLRQANRTDPTKRFCDNLPPIRNGYIKYTYGLEESSSALYYCNNGFIIKQRGYSRKCRCSSNNCYWSKSPRVCVVHELHEAWCFTSSLQQNCCEKSDSFD